MISDANFAAVLVLNAAFLHAIWNGMVKGAAERAVSIAMIMAGHALVGFVMVFIFSPPAVVSWPYLAVSTFVHALYCLFLFLSYRFGDLSQVYPIMRGIAPVLVAFGAQLFAGEILPPVAWGGILLVSCGISILIVGRNSGSIDRWTIGAAIATGILIASYSVLDGLGARAANSTMGYIGWLFLLEINITIGFLYYRRDQLAIISTSAYLWGLAGGLISALAYGMVIYAKTLTALGTVSALRESSVIIAALIGVVWFGERPWKLRVIAAIIVACGIVLLIRS